MTEIIFGSILVLFGLSLGSRMLHEIFGKRCPTCNSVTIENEYDWKHDPEDYCPICKKFI